MKLGEFSKPDGEILEFGQTFRLDLDDAKGDNTRVKLPHPEIIEASEVGHNLLIDDGKVKFTVIRKGKNYLECRVDVAGKVKDRKGVNTPDSVLAISPLTPKDRSDLEYMVCFLLLLKYGHSRNLSCVGFVLTYSIFIFLNNFFIASNRCRLGSIIICTNTCRY